MDELLPFTNLSNLNLYFLFTCSLSYFCSSCTCCLHLPEFRSGGCWPPCCWFRFLLGDSSHFFCFVLFSTFHKVCRCCALALSIPEFLTPVTSRLKCLAFVPPFLLCSIYLVLWSFLELDNDHC